MSEPVAFEDLVTLIQRATAQVFEMMLGMQVESLEPYCESEPPQPVEGLLALIGFAGTWVGTGTFTCNSQTGCRIADSLFMNTHTSVEDEVLDAVAEMTNMIL